MSTIPPPTSAAYPLVLPNPRPPPPPSAMSQPPLRPGTASSLGTTIAPIAEVEPTVDELLRETNDCRTLVSTISTQLFTLETLRNEVIGLGLTCPFSKLESLAGLTTLTGRLILSLSAPLATVTTRVGILSSLAEKNQAAALPSEISRITEELETLKLEVRQNVEKVKKAAFEEYEARDSTRRRLEDRVRSENFGLGEDQVERTCDGAMNGIRLTIEMIELNTYAGRVCVENPFTSVAQLIGDAADLHRKQQEGEALSRQATRTSLATTLVGGTSQYGKIEGGGEEGDGQEHQPLAGGLGAAELGQIGKGGTKLSLWQKLKLYWRDYLIRSFLILAVVGILVGITVNANARFLNSGDNSTRETSRGGRSVDERSVGEVGSNGGASSTLSALLPSSPSEVVSLHPVPVLAYHAFVVNPLTFANLVSQSSNPDFARYLARSGAGQLDPVGFVDADFADQLTALK
ncbi:hypothetical protein JCM16303_004604 [Sporobolomyces ruberrimus]